MQVTQARHEVGVGDPVALVQHMEVLLGSAHIVDEIDAADKSIGELGEQQGALQDDLDG